MAGHPEQDSVERARRGDPAAVAELYSRYWRAARAAAYSVTGNPALAEDAASEAFCVALENLSDLRDPARFAPWLRTIVLRIAKRLNRTRAVPFDTGRGESSFDLPATAQAERRELALMVHEAVGHLSETLRETVGLFYFEGYSIEEAARFLDVSPGTVKRRLHEGRRRLRAAVMKILQGGKPMDAQREQVLRRLRDLLETDGEAREFLEVMSQALSLRPPPVELLDAVRKRFMGKAVSVIKQDKRWENMVRSLLERYHGASDRAQDPSHPIGAAAQAIRVALPEFREYSLETQQVIDSAMGGGKPVPVPPELAKGRPGSFLNVTRGVLMLKPDGSMLSMREILQNNASPETDRKAMQMRACISDVVDLFWNRSGGVELHEVEELAAHLVEVAAPDTASRVVSHDHPHYRSALLLHLGDIVIPAALGGVLYRRPEMPEDIGSAHLRLYLGSWANARTGQVFEPEELPSEIDPA